MITYFCGTFNNMVVSILAFCCWLIAGFLAVKRFGKHLNFSVFLFFAAFGISFGLSSINPLFFTWDEQFHALVAKNGMTDFFHPTLFLDEPLNLSYSWVNATTWTHKQPFFTWLAVPFMKIFGVSTLSYRLVYCLLFGFFPIVIFNILRHSFSKKVAFWSSFTAIHASFLLLLVNGAVATDQNDFTFLFLVSLSFLFFLNWLKKPNFRWSLGIGLMVGFAVLTKWLVGILVFAPWLFLILRELKNRTLLKLHITHFLVAFGVALCIVLPWQIYAYTHFQEVYVYEMNYNTLHFFDEIEGHRGLFFYHFLYAVGRIYTYGIIFWTLFIFGLVKFWKDTTTQLKIVVLVPIVTIYLFFTMATTKMPAFTLPVYIFMLGFAVNGFFYACSFLKTKKQQFVTIFIGIVLLVIQLRPYKLMKSNGVYSLKNKEMMLNERRQWVRFMKQQPKGKKRVVFNVNFVESANINWIIFTDNIAYPHTPTQSQIDELIQKGYKPYFLLKGQDALDKDLKNINTIRFSTTSAP